MCAHGARLRVFCCRARKRCSVLLLLLLPTAPLAARALFATGSCSSHALFRRRRRRGLTPRTADDPSFWPRSREQKNAGIQLFLSTKREGVSTEGVTPRQDNVNANLWSVKPRDPVENDVRPTTLLIRALGREPKCGACPVRRLGRAAARRVLPRESKSLVSNPSAWYILLSDLSTPPPCSFAGCHQ